MQKITKTLFSLAIGILFYIGVALIFLGSGWGHSLIVADTARQIGKQELTAKTAKKNAKQKTSYDASKTKSVSSSELWKAKQYPAYPIGRMSIPEVNVHNPLFQGYGSNGQNLSFGVCTVVQGRQMGAANNYVLAGHYMGAYGPAVLDNLHYVEKGDIICVTDMSNIYLYKAEYKSYDIKPTQIEVENNAGNQRIITLITCSDFNVSKYGFGQHRTVVQGVFVKKLKATKKNLETCELTDKAAKKKAAASATSKVTKSSMPRVKEKWYQKLTLAQVVGTFSAIWLVVMVISLVKTWLF